MSEENNTAKQSSDRAFPPLPENFPAKLLSPYNPAETEARIYKLWEDSGFFNPDICIEKGATKADAKPFTMMMPPPNVTGVLHMGHALMISWQDTITRYKRMRGFKTLWLPGTDHAAIATQSKVEKEIKKAEGKSRHDLGREELLNRVEAFAQNSHDTIVNQVKALGSSCDWSREAFTLDETRNIAVRTIFKDMYNDGLIYRGTRVVNWDPKGQTTIADDEIVYQERKSKLYTFKYSKDFPISISTTRPETKVGDTAVAVHPTDERYAEFVGKEYDAVFCGVPIHIKIIADESVEKDFGTGALGVTPAHSMIDEAIAKKHGLPSIQVINEYAKMMVGDDRILGKKTTEARDIIVEWLRSENLLENEAEVSQNVGTAERTEGIIEPLPKLQWFIDVNKPFVMKHSDIEGISSGSETTLKQIMRQAVLGKQVELIPDYIDKTYFHWIDNLQDWCISRQIWYGHRIPVWYKNAGAENEEIYCGIEAPSGDGWTQDEDTLDTWFSSGLWTFSTLGWPEQTADFKTYHPTTLIQPGT
ncbi:MAG TPA: class I tRNA ligase family protein, partial [Candidatus Paceibacterota bacterium]|nr:class I tRNA ligase family protein [Candidatus Paceibacterota bacterium]